MQASISDDSLAMDWPVRKYVKHKIEVLSRMVDGFIYVIFFFHEKKISNLLSDFSRVVSDTLFSILLRISRSPIVITRTTSRRHTAGQAGLPGLLYHVRELLAVYSKAQMAVY